MNNPTALLKWFYILGARCRLPRLVNTLDRSGFGIEETFDFLTGIGNESTEALDE